MFSMVSCYIKGIYITTSFSLNTEILTERYIEYHVKLTQCELVQGDLSFCGPYTYCKIHTTRKQVNKYL